ncbi:hypothetical protein TWF730_007031 [Orbilia blumenaviensis]|uniref:F-box domain-containing protein n=1 Tax=Orbilia blumenaviensis TaxID=1796055 RepID=A0AAV9VG17_9PEZI
MEESSGAPAPDNTPNVSNTAPGLALIAGFTNINTQRTSNLGQLPPEVLLNILERLDQPHLSAFSLAASWCHAHAEELFYDCVHITLRSINHLTANPQHLPKIRGIIINCGRLIGSFGATVTFMNTLPKLRTITILEANTRNQALILFHLLAHLPVIPTLYRLEITVGDSPNNLTTPRSTAISSPDWDELQMRVQPNLRELSIHFGPVASALTRVDTLFFALFAQQKNHLEVLEVKVTDPRHPQQIRSSLKHFVFRCAEEEVNPNRLITVARLKSIEEYQDQYVKNLGSRSLKVFRLYSEARSPSLREREITAHEACQIFPNLTDLDFVTRASWNATFHTNRLIPLHTNLINFNHAGESKTQTAIGDPAREITESTVIPHGPISYRPTDIMNYLTSRWFPNIRTYGWYARNSTSTLSSAEEGITHRVRVRIIRNIWFVRWVPSFNGMASVNLPGYSYICHWWGKATQIYLA